MKRTLQLNPLNKTATWEEIEAIRDEFRISPISLDDGRTFHVDPVSFNLMYDAIDEFDNLEELDDQFRLGWKMTDGNYTPLTKVALTSVLAELKTKRAKRASKYQVRAEVFGASPPTLEYLKNQSNWDT